MWFERVECARDHYLAHELSISSLHHRHVDRHIRPQLRRKRRELRREPKLDDAVSRFETRVLCWRVGERRQLHPRKRHELHGAWAERPRAPFWAFEKPC